MRQRIVPQMELDFPQTYWDLAGLPGKVDVDKPWITGIRQESVADIVVSRTHRYPGKLDWICLKEYADRCVFVGLEEEWSAFRSDYFNIEFYRPRDLLDFAQVVAGAKLFVGNQSFGLALADAMLMPRVAQLAETSPNRMPPRNAHRTLTSRLLRAYLDT